MSRRYQKDDSILDDLFELFLKSPFWLGPLLTLLVFTAFRWCIPLITPYVFANVQANGESHQMVTTVSTFVAPILALCVLLPWVAAQGVNWRRRRRFNSQTGIASVRKLNWREFEVLVAEAFRRQGFNIEVLGGDEPDGGIDVRLSKAGAVTLVQCKHWRHEQVGVKIVRELMGVVASERAQSGIVITSGTFTDDAKKFAERNPIRLIDGEELAQMIAEVQSRLNQPEKSAHFAAATSSPICPHCESSMTIKLARKGVGAGQQFWSCTRFPECRGSRPFNSSVSN